MRTLLFSVLTILFSNTLALAEVQTKTVDYTYDGATFKGFLAWNDSTNEKRPGILVVHEFWGLNDYARERAKQLAELGYVAFAADMYGDGKTTTHSHEAMGMMNAVKENLPLWRGRAKAALATLQADPHVDGSRLVSIGYCFGGATSLELAYSDANIIAAISFHGSLPLPGDKDVVKAEILVLAGAEDPFVKKEAVEELRKELSAKKANFKIVSYPDAKHGFTVKDAEKKGLDGLEYNETADQESWQEMLKLFNRIF